MLAAEVKAYKNQKSYTKRHNFMPNFNTRISKKNVYPSTMFLTDITEEKKIIALYLTEKMNFIAKRCISELC